MKVYAYLRVSCDKSTVENQRFEILKYVAEKKIVVDKWIEETQSGTLKASERELGKVISEMKKGDLLLASEVTRIGRSLMDVMSTLNVLMEKECLLYTVKENFELGDNINSKVMAFAFGLSAEIERSMISSRTKESLQRKKANGEHLGRPYGIRIENKKLSEHESEIKRLISANVSVRSIARIYKVHPLTVKRFINNFRIS